MPFCEPEETVLNEKAVRAAKHAIAELTEDGSLTECSLTEKARKSIVGPYEKLINALGFAVVKTGSYISPRIKPCPVCKANKIELQSSIYESWKWLCQCQKCKARSVDGTGPMDAIRKWNDKEFTEGTELIYNKLDTKTMSLDGALSLIESAVSLAVQEYIANAKVEANNPTINNDAMNNEIECFVAQYTSYLKAGSTGVIERMRTMAYKAKEDVKAKKASK